MFKDEFREQYTTIPFATYTRNHQKNTVTKNIEGLFHNHKEIEFLTVLRGNAKMFIDTNEYDVKEGDTAIISPYLLHKTTIFSDMDFEHYCLCFDLEIIPDKELRNNLEKGLTKIVHIIKNEDKVSKTVSSCIKNAFNAHAHKKDGWELNAIGNMSVLFGLLKENGYVHNTFSSGKTENICYRIIDYIEKNYKQNITSADAAEALYMSNSYFCRLFKKNFGHCFQNYLCMYRIEKSKTLIRTTDMSVSDISMSVGFNSFSYFSKMFKEYVSVTPSEYKRLND